MRARERTPAKRGSMRARAAVVIDQMIETVSGSAAIGRAPGVTRAERKRRIPTAFHSSVNGRYARSEDGASYIDWKRPRPKAPK